MNIRDLQIGIAEASSAASVSWRTKKTTWGDLVDRLSIARVTNETYREFMAMSKPEQGKAKDVGAFVGGELLSAKRTRSGMGDRSLIALDIDFGEAGFSKHFGEIMKCAFFIHGTHKHNPAAKTYRYRVLLPIDRPVGNEEYEALARKVAELTGMDLYDRTTFQPERCMFFPSVSKDVDYYYEDFTDTYPVPLNVDETLALYDDWHDTTEWAYHKDEKGEVRNLAKEQQDPTLKNGVVGEFCRAYTISEAIERYLSDVYTPTDADDRWTYTGGSTAGGMITFDDMFAYSYHSTDPIQGNHVYNAFDLVRIHKFGKMDKNPKDKASFEAMTDLVYRDERVKTMQAQHVSNKAVEARDLYEAHNGEVITLDAEDTQADNVVVDLATKLDTDTKGKPMANSKNVSLILRYDPNVGGMIAKDLFKRKLVVTRVPMWRSRDLSPDLQDVDYAGIRKCIEDTYGISHMQKVDDAILLEARRNEFHPVVNFLNSLQWDNVPRLERLLIDYMGAEDCQYSKDVIRVMLVGAVKRVFMPGSKFDYMAVLKSEQGAGKSTLIRMLGKEWFSDSLSSMDGKEAFEQLQGSWILEVAELSAMRKSEVEGIKNFISKTEDKYRAAYARTTEICPRQCVFFGTTNQDEFLKDATGNRRFLPIEVKANENTHRLFEPDFPNYINMVWAEAVEMFKAGVPTLLSRESTEEAEARQAEHLETSAWKSAVEMYTEMRVPADWDDMNKAERITYATNYEEDITPADYKLIDNISVPAIIAEVCQIGGLSDRRLANELRDVMRNLSGWELCKEQKRCKAYGKTKVYVRVG